MFFRGGSGVLFSADGRLVCGEKYMKQHVAIEAYMMVTGSFNEEEQDGGSVFLSNNKESRST